jgi:ABC-type sulfate transport system permease subunit
VVLFAIILKSAGIYQGAALRSVNIFFILLGFILLMLDYQKSTSKQLTYVQAFLLLTRTGVYFCLLFLPILLIYIDTYHGELNQVIEHETSAADFPVLQIVFTTYQVTFPATIICAMTVAHLTKYGKKSK